MGIHERRRKTLPGRVLGTIELQEEQDRKNSNRDEEEGDGRSLDRSEGQSEVSIQENDIKKSATLQTSFKKKFCMVTHGYNPSTRKVETGRSLGLTGQPARRTGTFQAKGGPVSHQTDKNDNKNNIHVAWHFKNDTRGCQGNTWCFHGHRCKHVHVSDKEMEFQYMLQYGLTWKTSERKRSRHQRLHTA